MFILSYFLTLEISLSRYVDSQVDTVADNCNYVEVFLDTDQMTNTASVPHYRAQAYAIDVCRTSVTPDETLYMKYTCDGDYFYDEVYSNSGCLGEPLYTDILNESTSEWVDGSCGQVGNCNYTMMKTPCDNFDIYQILPVIMNTCIAMTSDRSYTGDCDPFQKAAWDECM